MYLWGHYFTQTSPKGVRNLKCLREMNLTACNLGPTLNVVVLQQMDVCSHVGDGPNVDHDHILQRGIPLLVKPTSQHHFEKWGENGKITPISSETLTAGTICLAKRGQRGKRSKTRKYTMDEHKCPDS